MSPEETEILRAKTGRIHSQESFGTVDGPGIRYVFFLQGCPLQCVFCHNPDSITTEGGELWTAGQAVDQVLRYRKYLKNGGVTLSGGEPLLQTPFATAIVVLLKAEGIHTAIDTSGFIHPDFCSEAIGAADLILLDIKALDSQLCRTISGKDNTNTLAFLEYCEAAKKPVWIRHVLLRGYTLEEALLQQLAQFLQPYTCIARVELLPFHKMGEYKWAQVGLPYLLKEVPETSLEEAQWARALFRNYGFTVQ